MILAVLLWTVPWLVLAASNTEAENGVYKIQKFENLPNLYFEDLGPARIFHETWTLITYTELSAIDNQEKKLREGISYLTSTCGTCPHLSMLHSMSVQMDLAQQDKRKLYATLGVSRTLRGRRGVFDFVGDISKVLFGTMSNSDATYYNQEIDAIHEDNKRNAELFKNQTQILKISLERTDGLIRDYNSKLEIIRNNFEVLSSKSDEIYRNEILLKTCFETEIAISEHHTIVTRLLDAVNSARRGEISQFL
ncbi:hypothetical protein KPH14_013045, partial [Odynerus spinipes]